MRRKRRPEPDNIGEEILRTEEKELHVLREIEHDLHHPTPTFIYFTEVTMNPTQAGSNQVFTGTLFPVGAKFPTDAAFTITSNDSAVSPSVDASGLVVSVSYPTGWTESTTNPLAFTYGASSPSNPGWSLAGTITPSAPPAAPLPTAIQFVQTT